jgi:NADPH-dependent curcumin reductase CurA
VKTEMKTKVMVLKKIPNGLPQTNDFKIMEEPISPIDEGQLLLKTIYVSVDPYLRGKMAGTILPRFELEAPISSKIIAEVVESRNSGYTKGEFVTHYLDWKEYQVSDGTALTKVDALAAPLSAYLGVLGVTGLSAYFALLNIGKPKSGETLVVSGAAGAVGSIAGQIGKLMGCRVVGIVGTDEKATLIKSKFGFDEAINYKTTPDLRTALCEACSDGVDVYFDNVGGTISDGVIANLNTYGRVAVCGSISNYNDTTEKFSPSLLPQMVYKILTIQGFLIGDFAQRFPEGLVQLATWLKEGKLTYSETIIEGFEHLPDAFIGLFEGRNEGKMIVKI